MAVPDSFLAKLRDHLDVSGDLLADAQLTELGLDSLGLVALLVDIEDTYSVTIPDGDLSWTTFSTADSLWAVVQRQIKASTK